MKDGKKEPPKRTGCECGWPLDSCWKDGLKKKGSTCGKEQHDRETERFVAKTGLEQTAEEHENKAKFFRLSAKVIKVNE